MFKKLGRMWSGAIPERPEKWKQAVCTRLWMYAPAEKTRAIDQEESTALIQKAIEDGVNYFDTATCMQGARKRLAGHYKEAYGKKYT